MQLPTASLFQTYPTTWLVRATPHASSRTKLSVKSHVLTSWMLVCPANAAHVRRSGSSGTEAGGRAGVEEGDVAGPKGSGPAAQLQSGGTDDSWQQVALQEQALLLGSPESGPPCRPWYRDKQVCVLATCERQVHTNGCPSQGLPVHAPAPVAVPACAGAAGSRRLCHCFVPIQPAGRSASHFCLGPYRRRRPGYEHGGAGLAPVLWRPVFHPVRLSRWVIAHPLCCLSTSHTNAASGACDGRRLQYVLPSSRRCLVFAHRHACCHSYGTAGASGHRIWATPAPCPGAPLLQHGCQRLCRPQRIQRL